MTSNKEKENVSRYRFGGGSVLLSRITEYAVLSILVTVSYALVVSGTNLIAKDFLQTSDQLIINGFLVFILAILINPLHQKLRTWIDAAFWHSQQMYQERLQVFNQHLTRLVKISTIVNKLRQHVQEDFQPSQMHIFVLDPETEQYATNIGKEIIPSTDLLFSNNSGIVQALSRRKRSFDIAESSSIPDFTQTDRSRLSLLGARLFIPVLGQNQLVGWIALSPRQSGKPYTNDDRRYLESLCDQVAVAIERTQVISNLEQRVREMDVLIRIAQGVNVTLNYDDILELIFTQISQVISTRDFKVTIAQEGNDFHYHAMIIQDNERYPERENLPVATDKGLEAFVIRTQHFLVTTNYASECRRLGVLPDSENLYAWMGIPMNSGARTIGVISVGSRDPSLVYTARQINLMQAIADQAAGAIVKARLLTDTENKALQLATLNEIGRSLTSTLEIKPLLNQILHSATEILKCEAGSLLMVDDQTGDLIFEVTVGPVAEDLIGQHLSAGTGIVGQSVHTGKPFIVNDVQKSEKWFSDADKHTGFFTRDILVVPMQIKEKVLGVIEVINKHDGAPFTLDDQELLSTFSSQAAIAIENARLYTQTDAALRSLVEEMSIMQRIDRELNSNLDLNRSLEITLAWSLRQLRAEAGMIGIPNGPLQGPHLSFRLVDYHGYAKPPQNQGNPGDLPQLYVVLQEASILGGLQQGIPIKPNLSEHTRAQPWVIKKQASALSDDPDIDPFLLEPTILESVHGAQTKILIPIRRQTEVLAIMILESSARDAFEEDAVTFLTRISDHAAIAISNAQLYADLQAANIAKSDFISLVSHELKTPMTSIKGYTDLLAQGSVGAINEVQSDFLNIIRSNTNRMATLVSDLTDISRIEADRLRLEFSALSFALVVSEVIKSTQAQIDGKQLQLNIDIPEDLPLLWADLERLTQIVSNLVSNAVKYTPERGTISISARITSNLEHTEGQSNTVQIDVSDTGIGIPLDEKNKVFEKFFRSEAHEVRSTTGTGLGLNITKHLVNLQGGKIWFESEPGKGSTFSFTVPTAAVL